MRDLKTTLNNFLFQIEDTLDIIRKTILRCLATFLIWFSIISGVGLAILITLKSMEIFL